MDRRTARHVLAGTLSIVAVAALIVGCTDEGADPLGAPTAAEAGGSIRYVAPDPEVFVQPVVIDEWVHGEGGPDTDAIHGHAWDLWRALTAPSGQELNGTPLPVWETWFSDAEVFLDAQDVAGADSRDLDPLNQSLHAGSLASPAGRDGGGSTEGAASATVLSFNRFTREILDTVHQNRWYDRSVLGALDDDLDLAGATPRERTIPELANTSVMVKPVWWIVPGDRPSMLPHWAGDGADATTDPSSPTWRTWRQCVLVDPTGASDDEREQLRSRERTCNAGQPGEVRLAGGSYDVVRAAADPEQSDLYTFELTQDEVDGLGQFKLMLDDTNRQDELDRVRAGDLAVLVAMHVSTREVPNWTWQTFWWSPDAASPPDWPPDAQAPPRDLTGPWASFDMCSAYSMDVVCFNPYLETDLTGLFSVDRSTDELVGRESNCMSCHRAASYHASEPVEYVARGELSPDDAAWFGSGVRTEFLWSVAFHAHDGPFAVPGASAPNDPG